jgi:hypothetical protein
MESRSTKTVRYKPSELDDFADAARAVGLGVTTYMREATLIGHRFLQMQTESQSRIRVTP